MVILDYLCYYGIVVKVEGHNNLRLFRSGYEESICLAEMAKTSVSGEVVRSGG